MESRDKINVKDAIAVTPDFFGPLLPYVKDEDVTDIDYNGTDVWIRTCHGKRYKAVELTSKMTVQFVSRFTMRIQTSVSKEFNPQHPLLEAETKELRISIVHESRCNGRRSICIRKTPTSVRIDTRSSVESGYATPIILSFLCNAVKAHFNITVCGEPGVGKTEFAKYVSMQIPDNERVITIEDNLEWHYHELKPEADCVEMQVSPQFDYFMAIKACLRQNPDWIMVSEVRGKEVANYLQQLTTGVHGITTVHTGDVGNVPDRLCNMAADTSSRTRTEGDIYTFLDIAVLVDMVITDEGLRKRRVSQVGMFFNNNGNYEMLRIFDNGQLIMPNLPPQTLVRFEKMHIDNPFVNDDIMRECKGLDLSIMDSVSGISSHVDPALLKAKPASVHTADTVSASPALKAPEPFPSIRETIKETHGDTPSFHERRRYKRLVLDTDVRVMLPAGGGSLDTIHVRDVSINGVGFTCDHMLCNTETGFKLIANFPRGGGEKPVSAELLVIRYVHGDDGLHYYGCRITRKGSGWVDYIESLPEGE